jgi:hypothetical protein
MVAVEEELSLVGCGEWVKLISNLPIFLSAIGRSD